VHSYSTRWIVAGMAMAGLSAAYISRVPTPTESYRWFIIDERSGKRRLTTP